MFIALPFESLFVILSSFLFFFNAPAITEISTLSLHDALPIFFFASHRMAFRRNYLSPKAYRISCSAFSRTGKETFRSEEHTSELQSHHDLVCRLLLEKKKKNHY